MAVTYEKVMRERAIKDGKGLITIEMVEPGTRPGKLGGKICMQGPADAAEIARVLKCFHDLVRSRTSA